MAKCDCCEEEMEGRKRVSQGDGVMFCPSCDHDMEHMGCQNYPNCDMFGCGPDRDVGHRG